MKTFGSLFKRKSIGLLNKYLTGNSLDYKQIFAIIFPILVDHAFLMIMTLLNTAMISSSGVAAISAVSMVDSLNIFIVSVFIAIATGGTVIVAQYRGSGNDAKVSKAATQAISGTTALSLIITIIVIVFHSSALNLLFGHADADVMQLARVFLIGSAVTFPMFAMYQAVVGALRGVAETKATLGLSLLMNVIYFVLNLLLITLLDMGVIGLVISLIISRFIGMVSSLYYLWKHSHAIHFLFRDLFKFDMSMFKRIMAIGMPFSAEQLFFHGGKLLTQTFIVQFGTLALTINAISNAILSVYQVGAAALSVAIVTIVGQCIGRGELQDARKFTRSFIGLCAWWFVVMAAIILPLFPFIVQLFSPPDEIIPEIFKLILITAVAHPLFWALSFLMPAVLRAAGDSKFTSITAMMTMWFIRVILGYFLGVTLQMGVLGIWLAMVVEWGVRSFFFWLRYRGDKWHRHKLI